MIFIEQQSLSKYLVSPILSTDLSITGFNRNEIINFQSLGNSMKIYIDGLTSRAPFLVSLFMSCRKRLVCRIQVSIFWSQTI